MVEAFLADKAYDTNELLDMLKEADIAAIIPPVKSQKEQRTYSHELYRVRHVIENVFRALKRRRGIVAQSSPLLSSLLFMSGVCFSTVFQSTLSWEKKIVVKRKKKTALAYNAKAVFRQKI
jgi:transposase